MVSLKFAEDDQTFYTSEAILAPSVKEELPEVETSVRVYFSPEIIISHEDKKFNEKQIMYADETLFEVFDFELLEGDINTVLSQPYSILLTRDADNKYFGNSPVINKTLIIGEDKRNYTVKGVLKNIKGLDAKLLQVKGERMLGMCLMEVGEV